MSLQPSRTFRPRTSVRQHCADMDVPTWSCCIDEKRSETLHPPVDRDMVNVDASFSQEFFGVSIGKPLAELSPDRQQDHLGREPKASKR